MNKIKANRVGLYPAMICYSLLASNLVLAHDDYDHPEPSLIHIHTEACDHDDTGLIISPLLYLSGVFGSTDLENAELDTGSHDPSVDGFSIPALSVAADIHYGKHFAAYIEGIAAWDIDAAWDTELEEVYFKLNELPGGFSLKAGQFLTATGTVNSLHPHAWKFVDGQLGNIRFLGEDGLIIEGAELSWSLPTSWDDKFFASFGNAVEHEHDDTEEALWNDNVLSMRYVVSLAGNNHSNYIYGLSYIQGDNFMSETARLYGMDLTYSWYDNAHEGREFIWKNDLMYRDIDTDEGGFGEFAFSSSATYSFNPEWQVGLRYDYLEGVADSELPERHRVSPALTRYHEIASVDSFARLQYNYDDSEERGDDHSIWLQFGFEWGSKDNHVH